MKILEKFGKSEDFDQKVRSLVDEVKSQKNLYKENDTERRRLDAERKKERHYMLKLEEEHKKLREKKIKIQHGKKPEDETEMRLKSELNHREKQQNTIKKALEIEEKKHS